jgi:hypothetical protein
LGAGVLADKLLQAGGDARAAAKARRDLERLKGTIPPAP